MSARPPAPDRRSLVAASFALAACSSPTPPPVAVAVARAPSVAHPPPATAPTESEPERATAPPQFWGLAEVVGRAGDGTVRIVAGNQRVELRPDGAVSVAVEAPSGRIVSARELDRGRWLFVTSDDLALVADSFRGPFAFGKELPSSPLRTATGALPAVRLDGGRWVTVTEDELAPLGALGASAWAIHFFDARRAIALRAPGEIVETRDGGASWTPVALDGDLPNELLREADGRVVVAGLRGHYHLDGGALRPTTPTAAPSHDDRAALARWEAWWREHLWPHAAPSFALWDDGHAMRARELGGALYWTRDGVIYRLRRDGARDHLVLAARATCGLRAFGAKILAHCEGAAPRDGAWLSTVDPTTLTATPFHAPLRRGDTVVTSPDGGAVLVGDGGDVTAAPRWSLWSERSPRWRPFRVESGAGVSDLSASTVLMGHGFDAWAVPVEGSGEPVELMGLRAGMTHGEQIVAATLRRDGAAVVLTRVPGDEEQCALYLGAAAASMTRTLVSECGEVTEVAFVDARFGVIVEGQRVRVTRDGGLHWRDLARGHGVAPARLLAASRGAPASVLLEDGIVVAPYRLVARAPDDTEGNERWWREVQIPGTSDEEPEGGPVGTQRCAPTGAATPIPSPVATPRMVRVPLWLAGVQVTLELQRAAGGAVNVRVAWSGAGGVRGAFSGAAPWREAAMDFASPPRAGYALRGASAAGVIVERCLLPHDNEPEACDIRWFTPTGASVSFELQRSPGETAWVQRAAPDGAGWVVELGSTRRRERFEWSQWQHWSAERTLTRWGDLRRDLVAERYVALARIGGTWGAVRGVARQGQVELRFEPHGGGEARSIDLNESTRLCAGAAAPEADRWWDTAGLPSVVPYVPLPGASVTALAVGEDGWCVAQMYAHAGAFHWTRPGGGARDRDPWWLGADGRGAAVILAPGGRMVRRALRCDVPRAADGDEVGEFVE